MLEEVFEICPEQRTSKQHCDVGWPLTHQGQELLCLRGAGRYFCLSGSLSCAPSVHAFIFAATLECFSWKGHVREVSEEGQGKGSEEGKGKRQGSLLVEEREGAR